MNNQSFEDHIWMYGGSKTSPSRILDIVIGASCLLVSVLGMLGNSFALGYFVGKTDMASVLYKHICCCSVVICLCQIPFINSLLRGRDPGMFENKLFCGIWDALYRKANGFYALSVLCLTISRALSITFPFYRMKKGLVIATLYIYIIFWAFRFGAEFFVGFDLIYSAQCSYCFHSYYIHSDNRTEDSNKSEFAVLFKKFGSIFPILEKCLVALLTVVSFTVVMTVLLSKSTTPATRGQQRRAAVTISIFTGFFLICSLPPFLFISLYQAAERFESLLFVFSFNFTYWHLWPLCEFLATLNVTLDVVIYLARMNNFRLGGYKK